ncbi:MAG: hypothetical protein KA360_05320, partial [Giesbergeria sp.]|nr:hypothetical protein [Giesbergeria sp.]
MANSPQLPLHTDNLILPLGALMLAASVSSWAQDSAATLSTITVKDSVEVQSKDTLRVKKTTVGKGNQ